jgi:hypothetical protein
LFESRVLRIFGPKRNEVTRGSRKLLKYELQNLQTNTRITISGMDTACSIFKEDEKYVRTLLESLEKSEHLEGLVIDERSLLKWIKEIGCKAVD